MTKTIAFFTGARSEYGIMKNLIFEINLNSNFEYKVYVSGLHLLASFGNTVDEIENDGIHVHQKIHAFKEGQEPGAHEFSTILNELSHVLKSDQPDALFVIGDRPETYAAVLAAHFVKIPVIHSGGGTLTKGAVDNIYRYNISNLATYHFATSKGNYNRLKSQAAIDEKNVFHTGSFAIDAIMKFKQKPKSISEWVPSLNASNFCLMTFHSVTQNVEDIPAIMNASISFILSKGSQVLLTYPNNDPGYQAIIKEIETWKDHEHVFIVNHLGAQGYYAALNECRFVIGNSSSGIVEAPYFNKQVINIGSRQEGREADDSITTVEAQADIVLKILEQKFNENWIEINSNHIYGDGDTLQKIAVLLNTTLFKTT
jgi:UDP-hydrolysing UDP-N-acetyl-D-glucosamine 2-epimerase